MCYGLPACTQTRIVQGCAITIARRPGLSNCEVGQANITAALVRRASELKVKVDTLFYVQLSM
jgi:hypothetical protein